VHAAYIFFDEAGAGLAEGDTVGGSGANFLVKWQAKSKVNPPLIEGVMIGTRSGQGISFVSRGQVINE
jgi:hypothetical protein